MRPSNLRTQASLFFQLVTDFADQIHRLSHLLGDSGVILVFQQFLGDEVRTHAGTGDTGLKPGAQAFTSRLHWW